MKKKKLIITETERKADLEKRQNRIIESFSENLNMLETPIKEETSEAVYINRDLADYFGFPYQNDGQRTIIHANTLRDAGDWDSTHMEIFDKYRGQDLELVGTGFGWWKIQNDMMQEQDPVGDGFGAEYGEGPEGSETLKALELLKKYVKMGEFDFEYDFNPVASGGNGPFILEIYFGEEEGEYHIKIDMLIDVHQLPYYHGYFNWENAEYDFIFEKVTFNDLELDEDLFSKNFNFNEIFSEKVMEDMDEYISDKLANFDEGY